MFGMQEVDEDYKQFKLGPKVPQTGTKNILHTKSITMGLPSRGAPARMDKLQIKYFLKYQGLLHGQ